MFITVAFFSVLFVLSTIAAYGAETLRFAHHQAVGSVLDIGAKKFAELVEQKTGGVVKVQIFPGGQLGGEIEAFELVHQGGIDGSIAGHVYFPRYYPPAEVTTVPFIFRDMEHAKRAFQGGVGEDLKKGMLEKSNIQILGHLILGFRDMIFRGAPITKVSGMKGVKMRSPEAHVWVRMYELLGAKPTPIAWGEAYISLQAGVVAGMDCPAQQALDMKFSEVIKSLVKTRHMVTIESILVNKNKMAKLSPKMRKAVEEAGFEAAAWTQKTVIKPALAVTYKTLEEKHGVKVVEPENHEEWVVAMKPYLNEVIAKYPASKKMVELVQAYK